MYALLPPSNLPSQSSPLAVVGGIERKPQRSTPISSQYIAPLLSFLLCLYISPPCKLSRNLRTTRRLIMAFQSTFSSFFRGWSVSVRILACTIYPYGNISLDIDPRQLLGWDHLSKSLRSLSIKRSGIEDISEIFIDAVSDDQARRDGQPAKVRPRRIIHRPLPARQQSWRGTPLPTLVAEQDDTPTPEKSGPVLSEMNWAFLKHLCLSDNALTFFPTNPIQYLTSITHLDLSSNLLISVPAGLSQLYNLVSLNLADNMIESVLGKGSFSYYTLYRRALIPCRNIYHAGASPHPQPRLEPNRVALRPRATGST